MGLEEELNENTYDEIAELTKALARTHKKLQETKARTDRMVRACIEAATDATLSMGKIKPVPVYKNPKARNGKKEVALHDTGDWQFSKVTTSYNSEVAEKRVHKFFDKAFEITEMHRKAVDVPEAHIIFGGDMIEGLFNYPTQPFEVDATLFEQWFRVSRIMVDIIRKALTRFDHVTITSEWGNHGRIGSRRDVVPRHDNIDRMCYEFARQLLFESGETRVTWEDSHEDVRRLEIGNYRALVLHGDEVGRNGFASPTTLVGHMERWKSGAYRVDGEPWAFRDVYIHHYHTHNEWSLGDGEGMLYQTASTESDNRYANIGMGKNAVPSQRLHFVDPVKGRVTAQYKIYLD